MSENHCIVTGATIMRENNSRAHVIPSALGGRLKPWNILSNEGNGLIGDKIDLPLIQAFQAIMTLLDGSRDRGENQPIRLTDESGRTYVLEFGKPLQLSEPKFLELSSTTGTEFRIEARTLREARTLLGRVKAKFPEFDVNEAIREAVVAQTWPDGMLHGRLQIGPSVVFPAAFVAASIFAVHHGYHAHPLLKEYVARFDPEKPELPPDAFYFMPSDRWFTAPGDVTHVMALVGDPAKQRLLAYIEYFNSVCVGIALPFAGSSPVQHTYAVDVVTGTEVQVSIDDRVLRKAPWSATHQLGDGALLRFTEDRVSALIALSRERAWRAELEALLTRALGPVDGRPLKPEDFANLVRELMRFTLTEWKHPTTTVMDRESDLQRFDGLCSQLETMLPLQARATYRTLVAPYRDELSSAIKHNQAV